MSKVLIREMKRCEFSGDKLGKFPNLFFFMHNVLLGSQLIF